MSLHLANWYIQIYKLCLIKATDTQFLNTASWKLYLFPSSGKTKAKEAFYSFEPNRAILNSWTRAREQSEVQGLRTAISDGPNLPLHYLTCR